MSGKDCLRMTGLQTRLKLGENTPNDRFYFMLQYYTQVILNYLELLKAHLQEVGISTDIDIIPLFESHNINGNSILQ